MMKLLFFFTPALSGDFSFGNVRLANNDPRGGKCRPGAETCELK